MKILIVKDSVIPPHRYGGTERVVYWLGKALHQMGHEVKFLAYEGSKSSFATVAAINPNVPIAEQLDTDFDIAHFHMPYDGDSPIPFICTIHGVADPGESYSMQSVFVSQNQARCHNGDTYVYNGVDYSEYGNFDPKTPREYIHFLAKTRWKIKNIPGAIRIAELAKTRMEIMGNQPFELARIKNILNPWCRFNGMAVGDLKNNIIAGSKGLIFPTLCQETFGLAIMESMFQGCPVFGTPYGSLPELITPETGVLATKASELAYAVKHASFNLQTIHEYATTLFSADAMAKSYLEVYEKALNKIPLHKSRPIHQAEYLQRDFPFSMD